jgi:hypothetical protein
MIGVCLGVLIMWLVQKQAPGGSPASTIYGIPFKPGVSSVLDAIGRVHSKTVESLRKPLCQAAHSEELGIMAELEKIEEPIPCTEFKLLLQQERDEFVKAEFDKEEDPVSRKLLINLYTEIDMLIDKIHKQFCKSETNTIEAKDIKKLVKEVREALCYDKEGYDKISLEKLKKEVGTAPQDMKIHVYDQMTPYTEVLKNTFTWIKNAIENGDDNEPAPWENRTLIAGAEGNPQSCIELADGESDDEELIFMHDDSDPRLVDFVIGGQTPEDAFTNGTLHACRQIEKRIVRESDDSGPTSITLPTATERFNRYLDACKGLDELTEANNFEATHTADYEDTPNIDEYVKGKKRVCLFYNKEELQAAATAEGEA